MPGNNDPSTGLLVATVVAIGAMVLAGCGGADDSSNVSASATEPTAATESTEVDDPETEPPETEPLESEPLESEPLESEPLESEPLESEPLETEPLETEPPETEPGPAPVGGDARGVWWSPPPDDFSASALWVFDPVSEALPYGTRTDYQPAGTLPEAGQQFAFAYGGDSGSLLLSYPTGTEQQLDLTGYDAAADVLSVVWEGYAQTWYGCGSGQMPPAALAAC